MCFQLQAEKPTPPTARKFHKMAIGPKPISLLKRKVAIAFEKTAAAWIKVP